jgi:hypothetical protein
MVRALRVLLPVLLTILSAPVSAARAIESADLLLVIASDVSRSVDRAKFELQRQGYAGAIADPLVLAAIKSGRYRRIAICFVEWSGTQKLVIDWTAIGDAESAHAFADRLLEAPRSFADSTSISGGIDFAMMQFERAPYEAARRTIDISGDGDNNAGRDINLARDEAVAKGVTINGLVILTDRPNSFSPQHTNPLGGLEKYYRDNVIGGPWSFVMVAQNVNSFGQAILNKLIVEIALAAHPRHAAVPSVR